MLSLVIPVYRNEASLPRLFEELEALAPGLGQPLELVFVVDGSPDDSLGYLRERLTAWPGPSQLVELSRNFGSFAAIGVGLRLARGEYLAVISADLQEPPSLVLEFERLLASGAADVVFGCREGRSDPWVSRVLSHGFWAFYRRLVVRDMPSGGIDVFGCTRQVRDHVVERGELSTNLIVLLLWLGFRRAFVPYRRRPRLEGRSAWTAGRKLRYALDSVFAFTDLPARLLLLLGTLSALGAIVAGGVVLGAWSRGGTVPDDALLMLVVVSFGGLTALGLGIVGEYLWVLLQTTRRLSGAIVRDVQCFGAQPAGDGDEVPATARNSS